MENLQEKIRVLILERDPKQLLYEVGVGVGVVVLCKVTHFLLKYTLLNPIPTFEFPLPRDDNFEAIKKGLDQGKLPKIFRPKIFPGSTFSDIFIIADFEVMKEAFSKRAISNRQFSDDVRASIKTMQRRINYDAIPKSILDKDDPLFKNGPSFVAGSADGPYDDFHKKTRVQWHDTMKRLAGKNKIEEIIAQTAEQTTVYLEKLGSSPEGMDPRKVFMNASINVTSGFAFEKNYDFEEEEFQEISEYIHEYFKGLTHYNIFQMTWNIFPRWNKTTYANFYKSRDKICESDWYQDLWYKTPVRHFLDAIPHFHGFVYKMIKEQRKTLDHANPRNYLETILIDAERDSNWGYFHLVATIIGVFLGASDTLANTMTWLSLVLADHPEVQEKMFEEIKAAREIDPDLKKENCPFTRSVLLESRRLNSVTDTLPHIVSEDIDVKGFHIPKNSQIFGSLVAVMRDPKNFVNPSKFIPDRFMKDGQFENDPKVCGFSVGLRNCIGKSLAIEEYFAFATTMVENFRLIRVAGNMELAKHPFLRIPKDDIRVQFVRR